MSQLIQLLEQAEQPFVSGQQLSKQLNCSRAAIWKQIEKLREQGYAIEAVSGKGYRLTSKPAKLDLSKLRSALQTCKLGQTIRYHAEVDSTQNVAQQLAVQGAEEGTVVIAEKQTAGRGRRGREWHSPAGVGLWFSLVLRPELPPQWIPQLTLLTAVSVCDAIYALTGLKPGIKWPNDLLMNGRKICGILLEAVSDDQRVKSIIAGIGITCNLMEDHIPDELRTIMTSLLLELRKSDSDDAIIDRERLLARILQQLSDDYEMYLTHGFSNIKERWERWSVLQHEPVRLHAKDRVLEGIAKGLDDYGALKVQLHSGELMSWHAGDVEAVRLITQ